MVETTGANRGITPSMRKGIKRNFIRYNADGRFSENNIKDKKPYINAKEQYGLITKARVLDIRYYLGDEWIDDDIIRSRGASQGVSLRSTSTKVYRCNKCLEPYQTGVDYIGVSGKGNMYVNKAVFINVPLERKECGLCE